MQLRSIRRRIDRLVLTLHYLKRVNTFKVELYFLLTILTHFVKNGICRHLCVNNIL